MGWAERLREALNEKYPSAEGAKSANSLPLSINLDQPLAVANDTNGAIGIEGFARKLSVETPPLAHSAASDVAADLVERLAIAMATDRPWQRVTDAALAMPYFREQARRRLAPLDRLARGLLVQAEEAAAARWRT